MNNLILNKPCWPNEKLEPVLITFNRAEELAKTLDAFLECGYQGMRLHVLDNASTDKTGETVAKYQDCWPELCYHRNMFNIGGNANYLRALEISNSEYSWVIGDDDEWFPNQFGELADALKEGDADVIRLGWLASETSRGKCLKLASMVQDEPLFFASVGMISAVVIRRDLFSRWMPEAYLAIGDAYPQLTPFYRQAEDTSILVFTTSSDLMRHTPSSQPGYFMSDLEWIACYVRSTRFLVSADLKQKVVIELMSYLKSFLNLQGNILLPTRILLYFALKSKAYGFDQIPYFFTLLGYSRGAIRLQTAFSLLVYLILPLTLVRATVRYARRRQGLPDDLEQVRFLFLKGREDRR